MVGLIQEQHPDRCRLFMQWKEMGWPILVDSLDLLEIGVVPLTLAIDEQGIVRQVGLRSNQAREIEDLFLDRSYPPRDEEVAAIPPSLDQLRQATAAQTPTAAQWSSYANALYLDGRVGSALEAYESAVALDPADGWSHFRLGVAYRTRYDSADPQKQDFHRAVRHWSQALEVDPNNYIWRRRIQQYGPRLEKPYPFYDWVTTARREIAARGETAVTLHVEPSDSEIARPQRTFEADPSELQEPDPDGRITRDDGRLVQVESAVVPARLAAGEATRIHLAFRPRHEVKAHWNNEADDLMVWVTAPAGWQIERRRLTFQNPPAVLSTEVRRLEVELKAPANASLTSVAELEGYALYYVCEDITGVCLYRRQDLSFPVSIVESTSLRE